MANSYLVLLEYLVNLSTHLNFEFKGKMKVIAVTYTGLSETKLADTFMSQHTRDVISIFYLVSSDKDLLIKGLVIFILNHGATTLSTMTLSVTTFG